LIYNHRYLSKETSDGNDLSCIRIPELNAY
jgi:hypothetical protein